MKRLYSNKAQQSFDLEFEKLMRPQVDYLYQIAFRLFGSEAEARDLVQDVLVKLYPRTQEMQEIERLKPWLAKVTYRQFVDTLRMNARKPENHQYHPEDTKGSIVESIACPGSNPEELAQNSATKEKLNAALGSLDHQQRALVTLHLIEGYTLDELTTVFDVPLGTLKSRLHRTKSALKKQLKMEPFNPKARVSS